jgi:hypothetical protein
MMLRRTAGLWGPLTFAGAAVLAARHQPGYSHRRNHVSGLAATGEASAAFMIPGFVAVAAAQGVMPAPTRTLERMVRAAALTSLAAGVVRVSDPRCPQPDDADATPADLGHAIASVATFALWTAMPFVAARDQGGGWYPGFARAISGPTVAAFVGAGVTTRFDLAVKGTAQRAFLATVFAFLAATSLAGRSGRPTRS